LVILAESSSADGARLRLRSNGFFRSRSWDMLSSSLGQLDILTSSLNEGVSRVIRIRPTGVSVSDNLTVGGTLDIGSAGFRSSGDGSIYGELLVRMPITAGGGVLAAGGAPGPLGVSNVGYAFEGSGGDNDSGLFSLADGEVSLFTDAFERVRVDGRNIAIGAGFVPQNNVHIRHQAAGANWGVRLESEAQSVFQAGMRVSNEGFFDITNHIAGHSGFARLTSSGVWTTVSDERAKEDIHHLDGALDRAMRLDPVAYRYKGTDTEEIGFTAQNVAAEFPSLVTRGDDLMTLNYSGLSTVAIAALQELKAEKDAQIDDLRASLARQAAETELLRVQLRALTEAMAAPRPE
jgi:hypothetical protein